MVVSQSLTWDFADGCIELQDEGYGFPFVGGGFVEEVRDIDLGAFTARLGAYWGGRFAAGSQKEAMNEQHGNDSMGQDWLPGTTLESHGDSPATDLVWRLSPEGRTKSSLQWQFL